MDENNRQRVYTEMTIPSFYCEGRRAPEMVARRNWTRAWWDSRRQAYQLMTSVAVIDELQASTYPNQDQALALLADIALVPIEPAIIEIVETYIQRMVMPRDPTGDALHLAIACYHKCDFLLTWNVQHLANRRETMQDDPVIARIREVRHRISKRFDHDPKKLVEYYMRLQAQHKDYLLNLTKLENREQAPPQA
jgi:predicted nucleic acid-binding protein